MAAERNKWTAEKEGGKVAAYEGQTVVLSFKPPLPLSIDEDDIIKHLSDFGFADYITEVDFVDEDTHVTFSDASVAPNVIRVIKNTLLQRQYQVTAAHLLNGAQKRMADNHHPPPPRPPAAKLMYSQIVSKSIPKSGSASGHAAATQSGRVTPPFVMQRHPVVTRSVSSKPEPAKPADSRPQPAKPADSCPQPTKPADSCPQPTKPADSRPQPTKPADSRPQPAKPADSRPQPAKPADSRPQPTKPADSRPQPTKPADSRPQPTKPADSRPQPTKPADSRPQPTKLADSRPQPTNSADSRPQPTKPADSRPQPTKPADSRSQPGVPSTARRVSPDTNLSPEPSRPPANVPKGGGGTRRDTGSQPQWGGASKPSGQQPQGGRANVSPQTRGSSTTVPPPASHATIGNPEPDWDSPPVTGAPTKDLPRSARPSAGGMGQPRPPSQQKVDLPQQPPHLADQQQTGDGFYTIVIQGLRPTLRDAELRNEMLKLNVVLDHCKLFPKDDGTKEAILKVSLEADARCIQAELPECTDLGDKITVKLQ